MRALPTLLLLVAVTGCTALVGEGAYTYDVDPCEPVDPALCGEGGQAIYLLVSDLDVFRGRGRMLDGFDLDGTDATVCSNPDTVGADGRRGVDNAVSPLVATLEVVAGEPFGESMRTSILAGETLSVIELGGIDDLTDDPCLVMRSRTARLPAGVTAAAAHLDADADGAVDPGVVLDFGSPHLQDSGACIIDGVLHARVDGVVIGPIGVGEGPSRRFRIRGEISEAGLSRAAWGGSFEVDGLVDGVRDAGLDDVTASSVLQAAADLDFDGERCRSLSYGFSFSAVPFTPGELRP